LPDGAGHFPRRLLLRMPMQMRRLTKKLFAGFPARMRQSEGATTIG